MPTVPGTHVLHNQYFLPDAGEVGGGVDHILLPVPSQLTESVNPRMHAPIEGLGL